MRNFDSWLAKVDFMVVQELGIGIADIPDFFWYDKFVDHKTPRQAFKEWMKDDQYGYKALFEPSGQVQSEVQQAENSEV